MTLNDIRNDLDENIFLDLDSRKDFIVSPELGDKNTLDLIDKAPEDIFLPGNNSLKVSQKYRFFSRKPKHYFDPVFYSRFKKNIHLKNFKYFDIQYIKQKFSEYRESYKNKNIGEGFKSFYENIPLRSNNLQKSHNFTKKYISQKSENYQENILNIGNENNIEGKNIIENNFLKSKISKYKEKLSGNNFPIIFSHNNFESIGMGKKIFGIIIMLFICIFGLKFFIEDNVNKGYSKLIALKNGELQGESLESQLSDIYGHFKTADILYTPIGFLPNQTVKNGYHVIKGGKQIGYFGNYFLDFYNSFNTKVSTIGIENIYISEFLEQNKQSFYDFEKSLSQSLLHYDKVTSIGDTLMQKKFDDTTIKLRKVVSYLKTINVNFDEFLGFLGHYEPKKYLIMFQNNDEIRPTGGFAGSMGIVSLYKGKILNIKKTDVYAYEWEINKTYNSISEKIPAPEGLNKITGTWGLRDANYYPEVKKSAHEIKDFLARINENIDGIIFINKSTIEEILRVSGGIEFPEIGEKLTDENFSRIMSTLVEAKVSKQGTLGTPKQILFDFAEKFYNGMKENNDYIPYAKVIFKHLLSRDIIVYSFQPEENSFLWKMGINGEIPFHKTLDFSYPVFTSISGNKSDRYIKTEYEKSVTQLSECKYETDLNIIRKHQYNKNEEDKVNQLLDKFEVINKEHIRYIQGKGDNYQYMRVFLPKYAQIEEKPGMVIQDFQRYKVVSFYMKTRLYETTGYKINYTLEKPNCNGYSFTLYKQPGITEYKMNLDIFNENIYARGVQKDFFIKR